MAVRTAMFDRRKLTQFLTGKKGRPSYVVIPIAIMVIFVFVGAFGPLLAPHSTTKPELSAIRQPPVWDAEGDWSRPLGTDNLGRDILSRLLVGARVSLTFALLAIGLAGTVGTALGLIAGYFGSWIDAILMRLVDLSLSIPVILMAIVFAVVFGPSFMNLAIVVAILFWAFYARLARGETLSIKERDFVALAKTSGASAPRIMIRHILPNLMHNLIVLATHQIGAVILTEATLSFLGAGIPPPDPTWGGMVADGRSMVDTAWWVSVFPGLAIGAVVLGTNLFGDWLRDKLDPRLRQV